MICNQKILTDLKNFYNKEAQKYYETRKKYRSDGSLVLDEIIKEKKEDINILELGCGSGRLSQFLHQQCTQPYHYTGVDIAENLLKFAQKDSPDHTFVYDDMLHFVGNQKTKSFDLIIAIASFQHLPTQEERYICMQHIHRILKDNGKLIMINRSISTRFVKRYKRDILTSLLRFLYSLGKRKWNDIMIPRKSGKDTLKRYYHLFSLQELKKITNRTGFTLERLSYIDRCGISIKNWKLSKNTILIATKDSNVL